MNRMQRAATLLMLLKSLRMNGSWGGETHLQKATYFLQCLFQVQLGFNFILYKHGPFSFDLRDEITGMLADEVMELQPHEPYGPSYHPGELSELIETNSRKFTSPLEKWVEFIAENLGSKGVAELERLATALYVTELDDTNQDSGIRANNLVNEKPHVSFEDALKAVNEVDAIIGEATTLRNSS